MCLAVPGRVLEMWDEGEWMKAGMVDFAGVHKQVNLSCVPDIQVGDFVVVHVGVALNKLDEQEARKTLELMDLATGDPT